ESKQESPQRTAFIDVKELPVDYQVVIHDRRLPPRTLDVKTEMPYPIDQVNRQRFNHSTTDFPLAFQRIIIRRLLATYALIFRDPNCAQRKSLYENSRWRRKARIQGPG